MWHFGTRILLRWMHLRFNRRRKKPSWSLPSLIRSRNSKKDRHKTPLAGNSYDQEGDKLKLANSKEHAETMNFGVNTSEQNELHRDHPWTESTNRPGSTLPCKRLSTLGHHPSYSPPDAVHICLQCKESWIRSAPKDTGTSLAIHLRAPSTQCKECGFDPLSGNQGSPWTLQPTTTKINMRDGRVKTKQTTRKGRRQQLQRPQSAYLYVGRIPLETLLGSHVGLVPFPKAVKCIGFVAQQHSEVPGGNPVGKDQLLVGK